MNDVKLMQKRDPALVAAAHQVLLLTKTCAKAAIETVSLQYDGVSVLSSELKNEVAEIPKNKLQDMLLGCPGFGQFFQSLEAKDKRLFVNMCEIVEIKSEKKVLSEYSPAHAIIIILKGELISFTKAGPGAIFRAGEILGIKEVLFDLCWHENLYGRQNGYLVKVKRDYFNDLGNTFVKSAMHIFDYLVKFECSKIRARHANAKPVQAGNSLLGELNINEEDEKLEKRAKEANRFVELYIVSKPKPVTTTTSKNEEELEPFKAPKDTPPLMLIPAYKTIVKQDAEKNGKKEDKREEDRKGGMSIYLKEKLEHQLEERKRKEKDIRNRKKKGLPYEELLQSSHPSTALKGAPPTLEALENEYERLKNDYNLRELSRDRLNADHEKLMLKLEQVEQDVKMLKEKNIFITAERDRLKLHKELLGKVSQNEAGEDFVSRLSKTSKNTKNFNDVVASS